MNDELKNRILELSREVEKNSPQIEAALRRKGKKPDPVLVFIGAQYFECLNRLAKT